MMNFKKFGLFLCVIVLLLSGITLSAFAEEVKQTDENKELDLVIVIDKSGSMAESDREGQAKDATNSLISLLPVYRQSRVGVITFGESAENILSDMENGGLVSCENVADVEKIQSKVDSIQYDGEWTGMGNGLKKAKELLTANGRSDSKKAIFLFSDGTDDFGTGINAERKMAECTDNATDTVLWAKKNEYPIYCIGYNYNGSMAEGSEGYNKISNYSNETKGEARCMSDIKNIEEYFTDVIKKLMEIDDIPIKDGKFSIDASVVEANITITGNSEEDISKVELYNPSGERVEFVNSDNLRFSKQGNTAVIKLIMPAVGQWEIKNYQDKKISLLCYQNLGIESIIKYPDGNPSETAYQGDIINVNTYLISEKERIKEEALYKIIKEATITAVPANHPEKKQVVNMTYGNGQYNGSFTISENSTYTVTVQLSSDSFYRKNTFTVTSSNHPLVLLNDIDKVKVLKNKEKTIENIYQYVTDPEGDKITATVSAGDLSIAEPEIKDDNLVIKGKKWGSTTVKVQYKDAQGNTVDSTFKVRVIDLLAIAIIVLVFLLIIALIIFLIVLFIKRNKRFIGKLALMNMEIRDGDQMVQIEPEKDSETNLPYEDEYVISLGGVLTSKAKRNLKAVITHLLNALEFTTKDDEEKFIDCFYSKNDLMIKLLSIIQFEPTFRGTKGFDVIISQEKEAKRILKQHARIEINDQNRSVRVVIGEQLCVKLFNEKDQCIFSVEFKYIRNI